MRLLILLLASASVIASSPWDEKPPKNIAFKKYPPERTPKTAQWSSGVVTNCRNPKHLAFTFDDGINEGTGQVVKWLEKNGIKGTFFVLGESLENDWARDVAGRIKKAGHEVQSHSYDHADFTGLDDGSMRSQLEQTAKLIKRATGQSPRYFRPPYGYVNDQVMNVAWDLGYEVVNWSIDTNDWAGNAWSLPGLIGGNGPIILQHDRNFDPQVQDQALQKARKMGYRMVTLSECIKGREQEQVENNANQNDNNNANQNDNNNNDSDTNDNSELKPPRRGRKPVQRPITRTPVVIKPPIGKKNEKL